MLPPTSLPPPGKAWCLVSEAEMRKLKRQETDKTDKVSLMRERAQASKMEVKTRGKDILQMMRDTQLMKQDQHDARAELGRHNETKAVKETEEQEKRQTEQQVREELKDKDRWLDQRKKNICNLLAQIETKKALVVDADRTSAQKDKHVADQTEALKREEGNLDNLDKQLLSKQSEIDQCMAQSAVLQSYVNSKMRELETLRKEYLEELANSTKKKKKKK